jgi:hypothetical protein
MAHPLVINTLQVLHGVLPMSSSALSKKQVKDGPTECKEESSQSTPNAFDKYPSSFVIMGFFEIAQLHEPIGTGAFYSTSIQCIDGSRIAAEIRMPGIQSHHLPNDTVVFLIAHMAIVENLPILLESIYVSAIPGDPSYVDYQVPIPDMENPFVVVLGTVSSTPSIAQGHDRQFGVATSAPVRDTRFTSDVR